MKVAFFVGVFPSLQETFILNQITGLIDLGCEVEIFPWREGQAEAHNDVKKYGLIKKVHYCHMPNNILLRILKAFYLFIRHCCRRPSCNSLSKRHALGLRV